MAITKAEQRERRLLECELVREALEKVLRGRLFVCLFEGADEQDAVCANMTEDGTLETLRNAVRVLGRKHVH